MIISIFAAIAALAVLAALVVGKKVADQFDQAGAASAPSEGRRLYADSFLTAARSVEMRGIPLAMALSVSALETGWGTGAIFKKTLNLFSIKNSASWPGPTLSVLSKTEGNVSFRIYGSLAESVRDWVNLITSLSRYRPAYLAALAGDYKGFFQGLQRGGYAGADTEYAAKLTNTIKEVEKWA